MLKEPAHQIIHTIAAEIAQYISRKEGTLSETRKTDDFLIEWGFEKEVEAVRYDRMVAESESYKIGYNWAKKQNKDYLMQHFGLYFDQWNDAGLGRLSNEELSGINGKVETESFLEDVMGLEKTAHIESHNDKIKDSPATRKAMLTGILTAVKEANLSKGHLGK
jgi:hypothetical protein